jgi:hypothetical protein
LAKNIRELFNDGATCLGRLHEDFEVTKLYADSLSPKETAANIVLVEAVASKARMDMHVWAIAGRGIVRVPLAETGRKTYAAMGAKQAKWGIIEGMLRFDGMGLASSPALGPI